MGIFIASLGLSVSLVVLSDTQMMQYETQRTPVKSHPLFCKSYISHILNSL